MSFEKVAANAFIDELQKIAEDTGIEVPSLDVEDITNLLKEAGIGTIAQKGFGAIKSFGQQAGQAIQSGLGKVKQEVGHLQSALGQRMANPQANTSFSKFLPGETANTLRTGLGGLADYAKGLVQRVSPNLAGKIQSGVQKVTKAAVPIEASSKATSLANRAIQSGIGSQAAQGIQSYLHARHPIASGLIGGAVYNAGQAASNLGGRVINAFDRFRQQAPIQPIQKAAMLEDLVYA